MAPPRVRITAQGIEVWRDGEWQLAEVVDAPAPTLGTFSDSEWWDQPGYWGEHPY